MTELIRCSCTRINNPWRRFCGGCGLSLAPACACGFVNGKSDRFCGGCGVAMNLAVDVKGLGASTVRARPANVERPSREESTMPIELLREIIVDTNADA